MTVSSGSDQLGGDGPGEAGVSGSVPGLAEQIEHIADLVSKLISRSEEAARSQQENIINGNTEEGELGQLREAVSDKERVMAEMVNKFSKNRQILTSNWEQAESEVCMNRYEMCEVFTVMHWPGEETGRHLPRHCVPSAGLPGHAARPHPAAPQPCQSHHQPQGGERQGGRRDHGRGYPE